MTGSRTTVHQMLDRARAGLDRLSPAAALRATREGALIVDIRSADQRREAGVVPGALHAPRTALEWRVDPASPDCLPQIRGLDVRLILLCSEGYSSSLAAATLQELGFAHATDVVGGFAAWRAEGLPVEDARQADA